MLGELTTSDSILPSDKYSAKTASCQAFLVAGGARTALLAGVGDKHLVLAVWAANAGKALFEIATLQKCLHRAFNDRPRPACGCPAVLGLKTLVVDPLEGLKMLVHQTPQVGGLRIAWAIQGGRLDTRRRHDRHCSNPVIVYEQSLEHMYTICQSDAAGHACNWLGSRRLRRAWFFQASIFQRGKPVGKCNLRRERRSGGDGGDSEQGDWDPYPQRASVAPPTQFRSGVRLTSPPTRATVATLRKRA